MEKIEFFFEYPDYGLECKIYGRITYGEHDFAFLKPVQLSLERNPDPGKIEPFLSLSGHFLRPFLQAMANLCEKHGIRPEDKPILENELTATKYHLEDMRKLVFKES